MLGVLKCFSSLGAIIMLVVGLIFTGITVYAFLNQDVFITDQDIKHTVLNSLLIISTVLVGIAINGIIGVIRKNCFMIFMYQIALLVFIAIFIGLGAGSKILPDKVFEGNCTQSTNSLIGKANQLYTTSDTYFCHKQCPCAINDNVFAQYSDQEQNTLKANYTINETGVLATQNCQFFKNQTNQTISAVADTLREIQNIFQCSDWCESSSNDNLFYRFSDVNNGKPKSFCYTKLKDSFFRYSDVVGLASFIIASVLLLVCICNICLCCHPDRKQLKFRDRFIYVADRPGANMSYQNFNTTRR